MTEKTKDKESRYSIKTVERSLKILDLATAAGVPISIQEICASLQINSKIAEKLLGAIISSGYMEMDEATETYRLTIKPLRFSKIVIQGLDIRKRTMPFLEILSTYYPKANINMGILDSDDVIIIDRIDSQSLPRTYFIPGRSIPFHCTAMGKVLTSYLPEDKLDDFIALHGLKSFTQKTITEPAALKAELRKVRKEQVARDYNEHFEGDNCIGAPVFDRNAQVVAAISLSAFEMQMSCAEIEAAIPKLKETALKISNLLGYNPSF